MDPNPDSRTFDSSPTPIGDLILKLKKIKDEGFQKK
jgi:hypothetical protein